MEASRILLERFEELVACKVGSTAFSCPGWRSFTIRGSEPPLTPLNTKIFKILKSIKPGSISELQLRDLEIRILRKILRL